MSSSNTPCAACKCQRRKCTQECVFAPYFPPDQPQKFTNVHKVFGASNVAKILNELHAGQREDAVNSLAYEAEARLRDPVYGCVGLISILQHRLKQVQIELYNAKRELANFIGPSAMSPILQHHPGFVQQQLNNPSPSSVIPYNISPILSLPAPQQQPHHHHRQQMLEAQQLAAVVAARERHEMLRTYEQQQQHELVRFNSGFDPAGHVGSSGFNAAAPMSPSLALHSFDNPYQIQQNPHEHIQLQPQLLQQQPQRSGSGERRSVGPSC